MSGYAKGVGDLQPVFPLHSLECAASRDRAEASVIAIDAPCDNTLHWLQQKKPLGRADKMPPCPLKQMVRPCIRSAPSVIGQLVGWAQFLTPPWRALQLTGRLGRNSCSSGGSLVRHHTICWACSCPDAIGQHASLRSSSSQPRPVSCFAKRVGNAALRLSYAWPYAAPSKPSMHTGLRSSSFRLMFTSYPVLRTCPELGAYASGSWHVNFLSRVNCLGQGWLNLADETDGYWLSQPLQAYGVLHIGTVNF